MRSIFALVCVLSLSLAACGEGATQNTPTNSTTASESASSWKQFLKEYEAWVDRYVETTEKYQKNPADTTILSDYTALANQAADWDARTKEMDEDLQKASVEELTEYQAELARIVQKLSQAVK